MKYQLLSIILIQRGVGSSGESEVDEVEVEFEVDEVKIQKERKSYKFYLV